MSSRYCINCPLSTETTDETARIDRRKRIFLWAMTRVNMAARKWSVGARGAVTGVWEEYPVTGSGYPKRLAWLEPALAGSVRHLTIARPEPREVPCLLRPVAVGR